MLSCGQLTTKDDLLGAFSQETANPIEHNSCTYQNYSAVFEEAGHGQHKCVCSQQFVYVIYDILLVSTKASHDQGRMQKCAQRGPVPPLPFHSPSSLEVGPLKPARRSGGML